MGVGEDLGDYDTIPVYKKTKELLDRLKKPGESYNDLVIRLIQGEEEREVITFPPEVDFDIDRAIVEAIRETKPPSKWGDLLKFLVIGIAGGVGLGVILPW